MFSFQVKAFGACSSLKGQLSFPGTVLGSVVQTRGSSLAAHEQESSSLMGKKEPNLKKQNEITIKKYFNAFKFCLLNAEIFGM